MQLTEKMNDFILEMEKEISEKSNLHNFSSKLE